MIYILVLLYTLSLFLIYNVGGKHKGESFHYRLLFIIVCCITGFSYRLGMDTTGYMDNFERLENIKYVAYHLNDYRYEPAFVLLLSCCKTIWNDFAMVQIVVGIFMNSVFFWFAKKYSKYYLFVIFIYFIYNFWNFNFEIKREGIAVCFFLLGVNRILKDKNHTKDFIYYYLFCSLSALFHHFGIITFLFPLATKLRLNRTFYLILTIIIVVSVFSSMFLKDIFTSLNNIAALYTNESITTYLESGKYGVAGSYTINGLITGIFIPFYMIYSIRNNISEKILSLALISFLIGIIATTQFFIFYRLQNYLCFFLFISYAKYVEVKCSYKDINHLFNRMVVLIFIFVLLFGKCQKSQYIRYAPYSSIFTREVNIEREAEYDRIATEYLYY